MNFVIKSLINFFRSPQTKIFFPIQKEKFTHTQAIIRAFYAIIFFFSITNIPFWSQYLNKTELAPLWPVYWLNYVNIYWGITAILWFHLIGGFLAVTCVRWRTARILVFLSLLEFLALKNSFGKIGHSDHLSLLLSFVLIFLPFGWNSFKNNKSIRIATLMVFSGCQALIMLTYTMSGLWKIIGIFYQAALGQVHALAPKALALQIADHLIGLNLTSYFGSWLIENYYVGWPLMIGNLYLQFFSLWAAFRPSLHMLWGCSLILFHLATQLTMNINFSNNCLWLALFFLCSPFAPKSFNWRQIIQDLPLIGLLFSKYVFAK